MSVILDEGGKGNSDDSRSIGEGRREKNKNGEDERGREEEIERDGGGCKQACSRWSG